jgi:hypothetical protein
MWLDIVGWEFYEVSDEGQIRSKGIYANVRGGGRAFRKGRILKPLKSGKYLHVSLVAPDGRKKTFNIHTLVLNAFRGERKEGQECWHIDGDAHNNHLANLVWGSSSENIEDRALHGRHDFKGEKHPMAKLTEVEVRWAREQYGRASTREIARVLGVNPSTVYSCVNGKNWKCVK